MQLFKKRKEARIKERDDNYLQTEQQFEDAIQKTTQIADPAEKVLALAKIVGQMNAEILSEYSKKDTVFSSKANKKKSREASTSHKVRLIDKGAFIVKTIDVVLQQNVVEISESPLKGQVLALPGISKMFSNAVANYIATPKTSEAEETPPANATPRNLRLKKPGNQL